MPNRNCGRCAHYEGFSKPEPPICKKCQTSYHDISRPEWVDRDLRDWQNVELAKPDKVKYSPILESFMESGRRNKQLKECLPQGEACFGGGSKTRSKKAKSKKPSLNALNNALYHNC